MKPSEAGRSYVRKVQEDTRRYAEHQASMVQKLEKLVASLGAERAALLVEVKALRTALEDREREQSRLSRQMAEFVDENKRLSNEYVQVERQSSSLASLYTASFQLHGSLERDEVLTAIQEIVSGLIGCEELAVFTADESGERLLRVSSFGLDEGRLTSVPLGTGVIGRTAATGERYVRNGNAPDPAATGEEGDLTTCIPLRVDGKVTGAIALFRLLSHKPGLEEADHELFDLLGTQAATALYCAELHARAAQG